ncbi:hypothetical protein [Caldisericum sp.]|uniref:hypothetical protein n=1 Tax=Caldisericum sp. TaxID=2499687 RepID=UPI003D0EEDA1
MKSLFKQKQWIFMQAVFAVLGILTGIIVKDITKGPAGGLAIGFHYISSTTEYAVPILFILFSDLMFNVEYVQGTFLTHLLCGQSRTEWMKKRFLNFYLFLLVQFVIMFFVLSISAGLITGHFGLEGVNKMILQNIQLVDFLKEDGKAISSNILKTLLFVSFGVFVSTLFPHKLVIGSITSIGMVLLYFKSSILLSHMFKGNEAVIHILEIISIQDLKSPWSWLFGIFVFLIFTWLAIENVKRIEIPNQRV